MIVIRVLGSVRIESPADDGSGTEVSVLPAQEARLLSVLVAARGPVTRDELVDGVWTEPTDPARLSPLLSRLRRRLRRCGIAISSGHGEHRLEGPDLVTAVDAYRFADHVTAGSALMTSGSPDAAVSRFDAAAQLWGDPFPIPDWDPPARCRHAAHRWDGLRRRLMRDWAALSVHRDDDHLLDVLAARPELAAGLDDIDALWMLRFLGTLRDDGTDAARSMIERTRLDRSYRPVATRADRLLELHEHGVDIAVPAPPAALPGPPPAGRESQLQAFGAVVSATLDGSAGPVAVIGPAGSGCTRMLQELGRLAAAAGIEVTTMSCRGADGLGTWRTLTGRLWTANLRLHPAAELGSRALEHAVTDFLLTDDEPDVLVLAAALTRLLRVHAARTPVLVGFDDAERMSPPARALHHAVQERLGRARVALVTAGRSAPVGGHHVTVEPLTRSDTAALLGAVWGRAPDPAELAWAHRHSGGLPAGLVHLAPPDRGAPGRWLAAAAVTAVGDEIDLALAAEVARVTPVDAERSLAEAAAAGTVRTVDGARFATPGSREEVLARLEPEPQWARALHARAFAALHRGGDDATDRAARHALAARTVLPDDEIARACLRAATVHLAGGAADAAADLLDRALRWTTDPTMRHRLLLLLGDAQRDRAETAAAEQAHLEAHRVAAGDPIAQAVAAVRLARRWSDPGLIDHDLLDLVRSARDALPGHADPRAHGLAVALDAHLAHKSAMASLGSSPDAVDLAHRCLGELDAGTIDAGTTCEVLTECRWALFDTARPAELIGYSTRLDLASRAAGSVHFRAEAMIALAIDEFRTGRLAAAHRAVERHRGLGTGRAFSNWLRATMDTMTDLWAGRFDVAEKRLHGEARDLADRLTGSGVSPADAITQTRTGQLFWLHREQGRMAQLAEHDVPDEVERRGYFPVWLAGGALAACETDHPELGADRVADLLAETDTLRALPQHGWAVPTLALLAETVDALAAADVALPGRVGLPEVLDRIAGRLAPLHGEIVMAGWPTVLLGPVERFSGLLALAAGDAAGAVALFRAARSRVGSALPQLTRLRYDEGRALVAVGGQDDRAAVLLSRAVRDADGLGMTRVATGARRLLQG